MAKYIRNVLCTLGLATAVALSGCNNDVGIPKARPGTKISKSSYFHPIDKDIGYIPSNNGFELYKSLKDGTEIKLKFVEDSMLKIRYSNKQEDFTMKEADYKIGKNGVDAIKDHQTEETCMTFKAKWHKTCDKKTIADKKPLFPKCLEHLKFERHLAYWAKKHKGKIMEAKGFSIYELIHGF